MQNKSKLDEKG